MAILVNKGVFISPHHVIYLYSKHYKCLDFFFTIVKQLLCISNGDCLNGCDSRI